MKENIHVSNVTQVMTVGELKKILEKYPNDTELIAETSNAMTELYIGTTHGIGGRDAEDETILVLGGRED